MKRIKIMLVAITVLAATGGVLAFKAKQDVKFCTVATVSGVCPPSQACIANQTFAVGKTTLDASVIQKCYTTTIKDFPCPALCTNLGRVQNFEN